MNSIKLITAAFAAIPIALAADSKNPNKYFSCNPQRDASCVSVEGFTEDYSVDFTQARSLNNDDWSWADQTEFEFNMQMGLVLPVRGYASSPVVFTSKYLHYGTVEVVMKTCPGKGIISGAILHSQIGDEIDFEMSGNNFGKQEPTVQSNFFHQAIPGHDMGWFNKTTTGMLDGDFHTYRIEWSEEKIVWKFDGVELRTLEKSKCPGLGQVSGFPQTPSRLMLSVWSGGKPGMAPGTIAWAGGDTPLDAFPAAGYIKSVKVWPIKKCKSYEYQDKSGGSDKIQCGTTRAGIYPTTSPTAAPSPWTGSFVLPFRFTSSCTETFPTMQNTMTDRVKAVSAPPSATSTSTSTAAAATASASTSETITLSAAHAGETHTSSQELTSTSSAARSETTSAAPSETTSATSVSTSNTTEYTTSTILSTIVSTIIACPSTVTNCPASEKTSAIVTKIVTVSTTVCFVTTTAVPTSSTTSAEPAKSQDGKAAPEKSKDSSIMPTVTSSTTGTLTNTVMIKSTGAVSGNGTNGTYAGGKQKPVTAGAAVNLANGIAAVGLSLGVFFVVGW